MDLLDNIIEATQEETITSRYGVVTSINNNICSVKEEDNDLTHDNVPLPSTFKVKTGDNVILGFVDNNIYNPYIISNLDGGDVFNELIILALGLGKFKIRDDGCLWVELPNNAINPFKIEDGKLYVDIPDGVSNNYELRDDKKLYYHREDD